MVSQAGISIFTCYVHNTRHDGKKLVANLDSTRQNHSKIILNLSATKICCTAL